MKLRACILFLCMAVVPLVAMFSHKVPREWRLAAQRLARGAEPAAKPPRQPEPGPPDLLPVAATATPSAARPAEPTPQPVALVPVAPSAELAMATTSAGVQRSEPSQAVDAARVRASTEDQLRALGAVSIECVPMMQGAAYRCSCRVPADPSGQLQRVFQSSNPDPVVALRNLHGQVQFWKHRLATRPDADNPLRTSGDGRPSGLR